jgi:hypothetical protein
MIPGIGPISGGAGGLSADLGGGPSTAGGGDNAGGGGNNTWNFAQPQYQAKAQQQTKTAQWQLFAVAGGVVGLVWLLTRKR